MSFSTDLARLAYELTNASKLPPKNMRKRLVELSAEASSLDRRSRDIADALIDIIGEPWFPDVT